MAYGHGGGVSFSSQNRTPRFQKLIRKKHRRMRKCKTVYFFDFGDDIKSARTRSILIVRSSRCPGSIALNLSFQTAQKRAPYDQYRPRWRRFETMVPKIGKISLNFEDFGSGLHFLSANAAGRGNIFESNMTLNGAMQSVR